MTCATQRLKKLDDVNVRKLQALAKWDQATHDAVLWLRNHKQLFKMEVIEPSLLCLTVPNKNYVQAVEACFHGSLIKVGSFFTDLVGFSYFFRQAFVAQCQEDLDIFNHHVNDTEKALGRRVQVGAWFRGGSENSLQPPPMSREEVYIIHPARLNALIS